MLFSPAQLFYAIKSNSKGVTFILCAIGWITIPVLCEGDVTVVGTLGGVSTGKGSGCTVTKKKKKEKEILKSI